MKNQSALRAVLIVACVAVVLPASAVPPEASGSAVTVAEVETATPTTVTRPTTIERRSSLALASGIVLASAGGLAISYVGATAMGNNDTSTARGVVLGGVLAIALGVPLIVYGAKRVPSEAGNAALPTLPKWAGGPSASGWSWRF